MDPKAPKDEFAQCGTCAHFIKDTGRCELHGADVEVDDDDSCGLYAHGKPEKGEEPQDYVTPKESGLVSREVRCENCMFFDPDSEPKEHCDLYTQLNRILPSAFNLDRYVKAQGCCNAQTPGKRNPKVFGPFGPISGANGEDDDGKGGMLSAINLAISKVKTG